MAKQYNIRIVAKTADLDKIKRTSNSTTFFGNSNEYALEKKFGCREAFCSEINNIQKRFTLLDRYYLDINTHPDAKYDKRIKTDIFGRNYTGHFYLGRSEDDKYLRFDFRFRDVYTLSLGLWCMLFNPSTSKNYFPETIDFFLKPHSNFGMSEVDRIGSAFYYHFVIENGRNIHGDTFIGPGNLVQNRVYTVFTHFKTFLQRYKQKIAYLYLTKVSNYANQYDYDLYFFIFCNQLNISLENTPRDLRKIAKGDDYV